ncbi:MAG: hypothetical protein WAL04_02465 [Acidimicrobiales bacterium]
MRVSQRAARVVAVVLAAAALVGVGFWGGTMLPTGTATPQVITGVVGLVGGVGNEFYLRPVGSGQPASYGLSDDIPWRDAHGTWNEGVAAIACMKPLSHGQRITFGVVNAKTEQGAPGGPMVVWLECPS